MRARPAGYRRLTARSPGTPLSFFRSGSPRQSADPPAGWGRPVALSFHTVKRELTSAEVCFTFSEVAWKAWAARFRGSKKTRMPEVRRVGAQDRGKRRVERVLDAGAWNELVDRSPHGLPLHHLEFLALLARCSNRELVPLGITEEGRLEAVYPLVVQRRGPGGVLKIGKNIDFYDGLIPPVCAEHVIAHLDLVCREARRNGTGIVTLCVFSGGPFEESLVRRLQAFGYEVIRHVSFVIPLQGRDLSSIRRFANRRTYRNLEHAKEHGLRVDDATEQEMDEIFPVLEKKAYRSTGGTFPFSGRVFGEIWRTYHGDRRFSMRSARVRDPSTGRDVVTGMALMVDNGRTANFWKLGTREEYEYTQSSTALYWDAVSIASARGVTDIDTGGAPSKGIAEYKRQWGAVEVPYYHVRSINMGRYRHIERARDVWRRALSRLRMRPPCPPAVVRSGAG